MGCYFSSSDSDDISIHEEALFLATTSAVSFVDATTRKKFNKLTQIMQYK